MFVALASCVHQGQSLDTTNNRYTPTDGVMEVATGKEWNQIASQIADQTYDSISQLKYLSHPLSVQLEQSSPFSDALHELIVTKLVSKGVIIKTAHDNRYYLKHDVDYISLDPNGVYANKTANVADANVKVLVNSSLIRDGIYLMRRTDEYYVKRDDLSVHSQKPGFKAKKLNVVN